MSFDAFLEIFNTLYSVDLVGGDHDLGKKSRSSLKKKKHPAGEAAGSKEGRCEGSWGGEGCGGR